MDCPPNDVSPCGRNIAQFGAGLEIWMRGERGKLSRHTAVAKAMDYMLRHWPSFTRFLGHGRICLTNNAAERSLRGIAGRKASLFAASDREGGRACGSDVFADCHGETERR
jgi:hypothetical protein